MISFIVESIASYGIGKGIDIFLKNDKSFKQRLYQVINSSKEEYEKVYNLQESRSSYSFIRSQAFLEELLKFRLFKKVGYKIDENNLEKELDKFPNFTKPSSEQLEAFIEIFDRKIKSDDELKLLEIEEFHKEEIFNISKKVDYLIDYLHSAFKETINLLEGEYQRELNECYQDIKYLKAKSALYRLNGIQEQILKHSKHSSKQLMARLFYIKGNCYELIGEIQEAREHLIKAYKFDPENLVYIERACFVYYNFGDLKYNELLKILETVLKVNYRDKKSTHFG
ncbi:hypothetical protein [Adhaeribacter terreus]|uniref:Tetratricopeptide repeat protein n=1 Tax=Adhaeribacter terreus TaxID=529703 RepID=A0ABW0EGP7_9BACT